MRYVNTYLILFLFISVCSLHTQAQCTDTTGIIYVDEAATSGANTGVCWTDAFLEVRDALAVADSGDQIWVAEGLYTPNDVLNDWFLTFNLVDGVAMYGGFSGTEDSLHQRDWEMNQTILSGDIYENGNSGLFIYTVVKAIGLGPETRLDGFIIEHGEAHEMDLSGGIYTDSSEAKFYNCLIRNNATMTHSGYPEHDYGAGGIMNIGGAPTFYNCHVLSNSTNSSKAFHVAGGVLNVNSNAIFDHCIFQSNGGVNSIQGGFVGGGSLNLGGSPQFIDCIYSANGSETLQWYSYSAGGQLNKSSTATSISCDFSLNTNSSSNNYMYASAGVLNHGGQPTLDDCSIIENSGTSVNGRSFLCGGILNYTGSPLIKDCVIRLNNVSSEYASGGVMNFNANPTFLRCMINENSVMHSIAESYSTGVGGVYHAGGSAVYSHCDISGNLASSSCLFSTVVSGGFLNDAANVELINCNISNNSSFSTTNSYIKAAGGILQINDSIDVFNCTIANNSSIVYSNNIENGGGLHIQSVLANMSNNIVYGNVTTTGGNYAVDLLNVGGSVLSDYDLFEAYTGGTNSIVGLDPSFVDADTAGSEALGDYRLRLSSVAINAGHENALPVDRFDIDQDGDSTELMSLDLNLIDRLASCYLDMGAYENSANSPCPEAKMLIGDSVIQCTGFFPVQLLASDTNMYYYLVDAESEEIMDGDQQGTGSTLLFSTSSMSQGSVEVHGVDASNTGYEFNGVTDFVEVQDHDLLDLDSMFTLSFWIKMSHSFPPSGTIFGKGDAYAITYNDSLNSLHFISTNYTGDDPSVDALLPFLDTVSWHYMTYTYDGDTLRGYVNNNLQFALARSFSLNANANNLFIGAADSNLENSAIIIDDLRIYSKALSARQRINEKPTCVIPDTFGLVALYRFNQDSIVPDESGHQLNGLSSSINIQRKLSIGSCVSNLVHISYDPDTTKTIIYVNANLESGWNNGFCWNDAFIDLQSAIAMADSGDQIWVADGIYYPTSIADRTISFELPNGVAIFGGFAGHEENLHERDWVNNLTILDGEISDNYFSYTVVKSIHSDTTTWLDGFTIRGGESIDNRTAGGIVTDSSFARFSNCIISHNGSDAQVGSEKIVAGGVYNKQGAPTFFNCIISDNTAYTLLYGYTVVAGGVLNENSHTTLINCTITNNFAAPQSYAIEYGSGGVFTLYDTSQFYNCIIWGNSAFGADVVDDFYPINSSNQIESCLFDAYTGGANCIVGEDPEFVSSTDFHVSDTSPVVNQGANVVLPVDIYDVDGDGDLLEGHPFSLDGAARTQACQRDMGVYETSQMQRSFGGMPASGAYFAETSISSDALILNTSDVKFHAGDHVLLLESFNVELGASFEAIIGPCPSN